MVDFEIVAKNNYITNPNHIVVTLNSTVMWEGYLHDPTKIQFCADPIEGENFLSVTLDNKDEENDTVVDENGKILQDTFVSIDSIKIDDYKVKHFVNKFGNIEVDWNLNKNAKKYFIENGADIDTVLNGSNFLALNATYVFTFGWPIRDWLLYNRNKEDDYVFNSLMKENPTLIEKVRDLIGYNNGCK
jgi:hypothetical protein